MNRFFFLIFLQCIIIYGCTKKNNLIKNIQSNKTYNIVTFGAINDTTKFSTLAIQNAIDSCNKNGGGIVLIPTGNYKISPIQLKSNVTLELQGGAVLWGDPNINNYTTLEQILFKTSINYSGLVVANNATNISIIGQGKIDGQGGSASFIGADASLRPRIILFHNCNIILVKNITLSSPAQWTQYYMECSGVTLDSIKVYSHSNVNNDGFDISAHNVKVTNCIVDSEDDGMCLKYDCVNVEISNCTIASDCNGIKLGTGSNAGFKNIYIHDCIVKSPSIKRSWVIKDETSPYSNISGLALEIVDGGVMDSVKIDNIDMSGIMNPLSIWLGDRSRDNPDKKGAPGTMQNIIISNINAVNVTTRMTSSITGNKYFDTVLNQQVYQVIKNVTLKNISFISPGNSTKIDTTIATLEPQNLYPDIYNLTPKIPHTNIAYTRPSYGIYIRHVNGITIENTTFGYLNNDIRPVLYLEDVHNLNATGIYYQTPTGNGSTIKALDTSNIKIIFNK